ncbi:MAG: cation:H+ antiporter [Patiriisocius sp.]|jgi:cation:H+ antiporter
MDYLILFTGLILLLVGGELLVKGAVGIALKLKIAPMIIGLTVVSFGTSAPELLVSLKAALSGHGDLAIGNIVGSNIANLALVLGVTALIITIPVEKNTMKIDWPFMMFSSLLLWYFISTDSYIEPFEGLIMVALLLSYLIFLVAKSRKDKKQRIAVDEEEDQKTYILYIIFILVGIGGLVGGAHWMVEGATSIAMSFGVSEYIIGVTVIAFGTSLPELATSVIAASRGRTDISVGNLVGSNIFNILAVLGITSSVTRIDVASQVLESDIFWLLGVTLMIFPMMCFTRKIGKVSGVILLSTYVFYIYVVIS